MTPVSSAHFVVGLVAGAMALLVACAPLIDLPPESSDGPRISSVSIDPHRALVGCETTLRFRFETHGQDVVGGLVRWSVSSGKRQTVDRMVLAPDAFAGATSGEVKVLLPLRKVGHYRFSLQIEDSAERWSNILEADGFAEVSWAWWMPACEAAPSSSPR